MPFTGPAQAFSDFRHRFPTDRGPISTEAAWRLGVRTNELDGQVRGVGEVVGCVNAVLELLDTFGELREALVPEERPELLRQPIERIDGGETAGKGQIVFHDIAAPFLPLAAPDDYD